jgi:transposase InsO family protein
MDTSADNTESNQDADVNQENDPSAMIAAQAQLCKSNEFSNFPSLKSNNILVPLVVEHVKTFGVLDTGSSFSIISPRFFKSLGNKVDFTPMDGTVQLGHSESTQPRIGYTLLDIYYNKISVKFKFEVFDFFSENNNIPILLGLDIMPKLRIGITGLVSSWFDYTGPSLPSPIDPEDIQPNNSPYGTEEERQLMHNTLKPLLAANANINLKDTYCNLPGAIVRLETKPGMTAYRKPYPLPIAHKQAVLDQIQTWKDEGVIELAQSHTGFNAPLLCVSKKDDQGVYSYKKPRVVADVRQLNSILLSTDRYQLPLISDIHQRMGSASIISSIDIHSCFTSFLVDPEHRHKLAFTCPFTNIQYIFRKICFGVSFMGSLCQRVLTNLFRDLPYVTVYVDDIQVATDAPLSHHTECVAEVLRRLTQANLQISPEKIVLGQKSIHILGWSLVNGQLIPDPRKISNIHTWPLPTTGKTVSRYLGFFNYFRSSIPMYATLAAKLDSLRNYKSLENVWTDEHTRAFRNLQTALASAPVLSPPDFRYRLHVATDASNSGIGGIIYYIKENKVHYIAMASRKLSTSEMNYSTTKRELLAVVYMFTKFHKWLFGITFTLHTDHKSLVFLNHQSTPNMLMLTWYEIIFSHSFDVVHIPGVSNIIPDSLSRLFSDDNNLEGDKSVCNNKNKRKDRSSRKTHGLLSKTERQVTHRSHKLGIKYRHRKIKDDNSYSSFPTSPLRMNNDNNNNDTTSFNNNNNDIITSFNNNNNDFATSFNSNNDTTTSLTTTSKNNTIVNRALQYADYMTPPEKDRMSIISKAHLLGHFGINAIEKTIHNDYKLHWTNMRQDIQKVVNDCPACQSHGIYRVGYHPPRSVLPDQVFDHISVDLGDFAITSASGNNFMLVVVDHFTRFTILRALPDKQSYTIAKELLSIFCLFGFPKIITMDNGLEWVNEVVTQLITMSGVDRRLSLPYTPLGNSVCERYVGISKRTIIKTLTANAATADSWDTYLDITQYSMNVQYARLHKSRPFSAMFFRHPNGFEDYTNVKPTIDIEKSDHKVIDEKLKYVKEVVIPALAKRIKETQLFDHERFEKSHKIIRDKYPLNSKVMITNVNRTAKVQPRWIGPLIIKGYTKNGSYILEDLAGSLLSRDVPTQQIRLIQAGDKRSANELKDKHYEVQAIVNHRGTPGNYEYYVHWAGYDDQAKYNTWQTVDTFDSMKPIQDYWARRQATSSQHSSNTRLPDTINKRKMPARNKYSRTRQPRVTRS